MPYQPQEIINTFKMDIKLKRELAHQLPKEKLVKMLEQMALTRCFEENAEELYTRGLVHGTMHLSIGMEASPVGSIAAIEKEDYIIHHHRGHGHTIAKGADLVRMVAEFIGKEAGYCRGRGGSMHIADIESGNLGATGVVAAGIPTAVGIGLALQMKKSQRVLLSFFGDGASNEGEFHESLNMASIWKLPIVFIVDNNQYGMSMASEKSMNIEYISQRACAYNIPGISVDGNDVLAVYHSVSEAVQRARRGEGISLIENITYRWRGHSKSDRNLYRTDEEIKAWQQFDPIQRFADFLIQEKILSLEEVEEIKQKAFQDIKEATEAALSLPEPTPDHLEEEVYAP